MKKEPMPLTQAQEKGLTSMDIAAERRARLREIMPEAFAGDQIDFEQLKRALGEEVYAGKERYGLIWPGKAECMKVIQAPSIATLKPAREESVNFDTTENLFIEGDNLEVLKLLQKSYFGKVKMIYIDPPYNTGKEFIYPDKYSETLETYLAYTGQIDDEGRRFATDTDAGGRRHARWLNMMYPRLYLARNLLREDGVIFISIDDNEQANLKLLCDLVFGEENFVANVVWQKKFSPQNDAKYFSDSHEHILCYARSLECFNIGLLPRSDEADSRYKNPDNDPRGDWTSGDLTRQEYRIRDYYEIISPRTGKKFFPPDGNSWGRPKEIIEKLIADNRIWFGTDGNSVPRLKRFLSEVKQGITPQTIWEREDVGDTQEGKKLIKEYFGNVGVFETPKPPRLIDRALTVSNVQDGDLILDFFAGSASTAEAVMLHEKKLKFLLIQLPEKTEVDSEPHKAGFKTIADIGKERIRRAAKKIAEEQAQRVIPDPSRVIPAHAGIHGLPLMMDSRVRGNDTGTSGKDTEGERPPLDLGFKVFKLAASNFRIWEGEKALESDDEAEQTATLLRMLDEHVDHLSQASTPEDILYELLLKAGFSLTIPIDKRVMAGKDVYSIEDGAMLICLDKHLNDAVIDAMAATHPIRVICLDEGFQGNDQLKANAVQTFKSRSLHEDSEIVFRTV